LFQSSSEIGARSWFQELLGLALATLPKSRLSVRMTIEEKKLSRIFSVSSDLDK
jgi:hypothetical protein